MNDIILHRESHKAMALPEPRQAIAIRKAVEADLSFIDGLQKLHSKAVGWFPRQQLEANIRKGQVLVAEQIYRGDRRDRGESHSGLSSPSIQASSASASSANSAVSTPLGYCISADRYLKHDDIGIVYQLNVVPGEQRGLIGASLVKAVFERAPYGCKLFCCWCAQDLEANHFWESVGFVPLAFRTGSRRAGSKKEPRIHIFWQRRVREGDADTTYWLPSETSGGAVPDAVVERRFGSVGHARGL